MHPAQKNRRNPQEYDRHLYKGRKCGECTFRLLKQFRRIATRYEKTSRNYLSLALFAGMMVWFR